MKLAILPVVQKRQNHESSDQKTCAKEEIDTKRLLTKMFQRSFFCGLILINRFKNKFIFVKCKHKNDLIFVKTTNGKMIINTI